MADNKYLQHLIDKSVDWFKKKQENSYDWILARIAVNGYNSNNNSCPTTDMIRSKVLCYVTSKLKRNVCMIGYLLKFFASNINNNDLNKDILLFLFSWNIQRFKSLYSNNELDFQKWINALKKIIENYKEGLCKLSDKEAFQNIYNIYNTTLGSREKVITAKTLLLLCPDKFIAWDNQIAKLFELSDMDAKDYSRFNNAISRFIEDHQFKLNIYLKEEDIHSYQYTERKVLDMILYIHANKKITEKTFVNASNELVSNIKSYINNSSIS